MNDEVVITETKYFSRNLRIATLASLLTDISSEMVVYLLPIFLASILKAPIAFIGLIEGTAETIASFAKLFSGYLSDRIGARKGLVILGYSLSTFAKPFLLIASTWQMVFGIRLVDLLGKGIRTAPRDALIADSVPSEQRGAAFGYHRAGDTLGAFIGISIVLAIIWLTQQQNALLTIETFRTVLLVSIIPGVLAVIALVFGINEIKPTAHATAPILSLRNFDYRFKFLLIIIAIFTLGNSADSFIVLRAQERGATIFETMLMVLAFNGIYALLSQPLGKLSDRLSRRTIILIGWLIYALVYFGLAVSQTPWQVGLLWAIYGVYYAFTEGALKAYVADIAPLEMRGTAYGLLNATIGLFALPSSFIMGLLWQWQGAWLAFMIGGILALLASLMLLWLLIKA
jgi:MFS family permease